MTTLNQTIAGLNPDIQKELSYYAAAIEKAYPTHVEAYRRYIHEKGYFDELCKRVNG